MTTEKKHFKKFTEKQLAVGTELLNHGNGALSATIVKNSGVNHNTTGDCIRLFMKYDLVEKIETRSGAAATFKPKPELLEAITNGGIPVGTAAEAQIGRLATPGVRTKGKLVSAPKPHRVVHFEQPPKKERPLAPDDPSVVARLKLIVDVLDEASVPKKEDGEPIMLEQRVQLLVDERDRAVDELEKLKKRISFSIDPKRLARILVKINTPAVRLLLGREPTADDLLERVTSLGISTLESELK